jgi:3-methyl-2-oxobutanoate hydroxymethyltransferase
MPLQLLEQLKELVVDYLWKLNLILKEALRSSIRIMKESGGHAVKLEGGKEIKESIKKILNAGIPVMGHLGLTPQSIYKFGTYTVRAKKEEEEDKLIEDAQLLERLGCFALVLEKYQLI